MTNIPVITFDPIFKRTSTGAIQTWHQEVQDNAWRSVSGQVDGLKVTSEWHKCEPKNTGKKNATTGHEQAMSEVESNYTKRLKMGYFKTIAEIDDKIYFKPMLAKKYDDYAGKLDFEAGIYTQPKLDGMRCIATVDGLFSRTGERIVSSPHVHEELVDLGVWDENDTLVFDGELYNHDLKDRFEELMSLARKSKPTDADLEASKNMIQYHIYDAYDGTNDTFAYRYNYLVPYFVSSRNIIHNVTTYRVYKQKELDDHNQWFVQSGYEGQMIRIAEAPYENKRSKNLLKRKDFVDTEFEIVDIEEGVGNRSGMAGNIKIRLHDGEICDSGIKGSHEYCKELLKNKHLYIGNGSEVTVRHFGYTAYGKPRFPVAVCLYQGKRTV